MNRFVSDDELLNMHESGRMDDDNSVNRVNQDTRVPFVQKENKESFSTYGLNYNPNGYDIAKKIYEFSKEHDVENIILLDRAARPAWVAIKKFYKLKEDKAVPNIYFISPTKLTNYGEITDSITDEFRTKFNSLIKNKEKSTLVFDVCSHSGSSLGLVQNLLDNEGFDKLYLGAGHTHSKGNEKFIDLLVSDGKYCNPFKTKYTVEKDPQSLTTRRNSDFVSWATAVNNYGYIKKFVQNKYNADK